MAKIEQRPTITLEVPIVLTEHEARALYALTEYGDKAFLKMTTTMLGDSGVRKHEVGLVSMFHSLRSALPGILRLTDEARWVFTGERVAVEPKEDLEK